MPPDSNERSIRILRVAGWVLGLWGLLLLADDFVGPNQHDNLAGVLFMLAGIATLLFARQRESRGNRHSEPGDESDPET